MQRRYFQLPAIGIVLAGLFCSCGGENPGTIPSGHEDTLAAARMTIKNGGVPTPDSITVDEFLSEHVISNNNQPDAEGVFVAVDTAWHRDFDAPTPQATIQIGFGANINPDTFKREALNLAVVIEQSASMNLPLDSRTGTTRFDTVKFAIDRMLARLTQQDLVSIVGFNGQSRTLLDGARGNNIAAIKGALDGIMLEGDADLAAGVLRGFQVAANRSSPTRIDRVIVFTDEKLSGQLTAQWNDFLGAIRTYAGNNIGITVFSVGSDIGVIMAREIEQIRGGNSVSLTDFDRIVNVFDKEFDFLVAPVAYDVTLNVNVPFEFDVVDVQGLPASRPYGHQLTLTAPTLFLNPVQGGGVAFIRTRAGALVDLKKANKFGDVTFTYATRKGSHAGFDSMPASLPAGLAPDADPDYFETQGVRRGVLLLNTALTLKAACADVFQLGFLSLDNGSRATAIARIIDFLDYFDALAAGLEDRLSPQSRSLSEERALLVKLRSNLGG